MLSIFLGKIIGFYLVIVSASMLIQYKHYAKMIHEFFSKKGHMCLAGILKIIVGLLIVLSHNIWEESWVTFITVIGWIILLSGIYILLFPQKAAECTKSMEKSNGFLWMHGICLAIGLYLLYLTYYYAQ
jgi:hypothetical protein